MQFSITGTTALLSAPLGFLSAMFAWLLLIGRETRFKVRKSACMVVLASTSLLAGCGFSFSFNSDDDYDYEYDRDKPIYMSYETLRSSVEMQSPHTMKSMGSLYLYEDHLFINEKNKGLHVINNADPGQPQAKGFLNIPGNTAVAIRDGILFADSFIDLVAIDIRDPNNIHEVSRQIDIFPYDAYQAIDPEDSVRFWYSDLDESKGVVIGYE